MVKKILLIINLLFFIFIWGIIAIQRHSFIGEIGISPLPLLLIVFVVFALISIAVFVAKKPKRYTSAILMIAALIIGTLPLFLNIFDFYFNRPTTFSESTSSNALVVFSLNIHYRNTKLEEIANLIKKESPDVVMLYELTPDQFPVLQDLLPEYPYAFEPSYDYNGGFSKIKPISFEYKDAANSYTFTKITVNKNNTDYVVYGIHPPSLMGDGHIIKRTAYLGKLVEDIQNEEIENIVIAGDYNMTPWVWGYADLMDDLNNEFVNAGKGSGIYNTWGYPRGVDNPVTVIDHIFVSKELTYSDFKTIWVDLSDHRALMVKVE